MQGYMGGTAPRPTPLHRVATFLFTFTSSLLLLHRRLEKLLSSARLAACEHFPRPPAPLYILLGPFRGHGCFGWEMSQGASSCQSGQAPRGSLGSPRNSNLLIGFVEQRYSASFSSHVCDRRS